MATETVKRFQTGKEVMETYIPNYVPRSKGAHLPSSQFSPEGSGVDLANSIVKDFTARLLAKKDKLLKQKSR